MTPTNKRTLKNLAKLLSQIRKAKSISRQQLADKSGVHYDAIARIERGERKPIVTTLCSIASALDIHVAELLVDPKK